MEGISTAFSPEMVAPSLRADAGISETLDPTFHVGPGFDTYVKELQQHADLSAISKTVSAYRHS